MPYIVQDNTRSVRQEFAITIPPNCENFSVVRSMPGEDERTVAEFCDGKDARLFAEAEALRDCLSTAVKYLQKAQNDGAFAGCCLDAGILIQRAKEIIARAGA